MKKYGLIYKNYVPLVGSIIIGGYMTLNYLLNDYKEQNRVDRDNTSKNNLIFFLNK